MTRPQRNREHLKGVANDLGYEWWMAAESVNRIETLRESSDVGITWMCISHVLPNMQKSI